MDILIVTLDGKNCRVGCLWILRPESIEYVVNVLQEELTNGTPCWMGGK